MNLRISSRRRFLSGGVGNQKSRKFNTIHCFGNPDDDSEGAIVIHSTPLATVRRLRMRKGAVIRPRGRVLPLSIAFTAPIRLATQKLGTAG